MKPNNLYTGFAEKWSFFSKLFQGRRNQGIKATADDADGTDDGEQIRNPNIEIRNKFELTKG